MTPEEAKARAYIVAEEHGMAETYHEDPMILHFLIALIQADGNFGGHASEELFDMADEIDRNWGEDASMDIFDAMVSTYPSWRGRIYRNKF